MHSQAYRVSGWIGPGVELRPLSDARPGCRAETVAAFVGAIGTASSSPVIEGCLPVRIPLPEPSSSAIVLAHSSARGSCSGQAEAEPALMMQPSLVRRERCLLVVVKLHAMNDEGENEGSGA